MSVAETIYGRSRRRKLIPLASIAMISEFAAIFEVKKITEMKTKSGLKRFA